MIQTAPSPVDILDFQFKLHCRLKVFHNDSSSNFNNECNIVASGSKYGLLFVGTTEPFFQVIQLQNIEKYSTKNGEVTDYLRRNITTPSRVQHLSVNCDSTTLSAIVEKEGCATAIIYSIESFLQQNITVSQEIRLSATPGVKILEAAWNPAIPSMYAVCKDDGSLGVYNLKESSIEINELPKTTGATCICWSPRGKQIAVGSRDGKIIQYKPDLKIAKVITGPTLKGRQFPTTLQWISNYQFIAVYREDTADSQSNLIVINCPKVGDTAYVNYEDICYSYGTARPYQFYMMLQNAWNILMVASANSMEVGVLGFEKDVWTQWILSDSARAELPLSVTKQETLPVGLCLDISSTKAIPWGESTLPPAPLLMILSHHGVLCCFHAINLKKDAPHICVPPEKINENAMIYFTSSLEKTGQLPNKPIAINPSKQTIPVTNQQPSVTTFSFTFTQTSKPIATNANMPILQIPRPDKDLIPALPSNLKTTTSNSTPSDNILFKSNKSAIGYQTTNLSSKVQPTQKLSDVKTNVNDAKTLLPVTPNTTLPIERSPVVNFRDEDTESLIAQMIKEECTMLESELKALLQRGQSIKIELGSDKEATNLARSTNAVQEFLDEINDICQTQSTEIICLKQTLIQIWAWYEEARSRFTTNKDSALMTLMCAQPLDAVSARQLAEINHILYYLDSQLRQANAAVDDQWELFQDSCRKKLSFKLPNSETIYQTMVKQSATVQKQVYMVKDISARIKSKVRPNTIPHLLISPDYTDKLKHQLYSLHIDSKDLLHLQYERVFNRQKQLSTHKIQELKNVLKDRRIIRISVNRPQLLSSSAQLSGLVNAPFSPIVPDKKLQPQKLNFIQSTPKVLGSDHSVNAVISAELSKVYERAEIGGDMTEISTKRLLQQQNFKNLELVNFNSPHVITVTETTSKASGIPVSVTSSNVFGFGEPKTSSGSAFVPTTQNMFGVKTVLFSVTTAGGTSAEKPNTVSSGDIFSFNTHVSLTTSINNSSLTTTTSTSTFSTPLSSTSADSVSKPSLFITKPPNTAVPTSKFMFGTPLSSNVNIVLPTTSSIFSFSNFPTKLENVTTSTSSELNARTTFSNPIPSVKSAYSPTFENTNSDVITSKSMFSFLPTTATQTLETPNTTTQNAYVAPLISSTSSLVSKPLEIPPHTFAASKVSTNVTTFTSSSTATIVLTNPLSNSQTIQASKPSNTITTFTPNISTSSFSNNTTSLTSKTCGAITIEPIITSMSQPGLTDITPDIHVVSLDATTATKITNKNSNSIADSVTIAKNIALTDSKLLVYNPTTTSSMSTTTSLYVASTPTLIPSNNNTESAFSKAPTTSHFGATQQSTISVFSTTKLLPASNENTSTSSVSIFEIPQKSLPEVNVSTSSSTVISSAQSIFGSSIISNSTVPSIFNTNSPDSVTQTSPFNSSNISSSTTQTPIFGSNNTSSVTQTTIFGVNSTANTSSQLIYDTLVTPVTSTSIFGTPSTSLTTGNIFGTSDSVFSTNKTSANSIFGSVSSFSTTNTTPSRLFPQSTSTSTLFGQPASFGTGSIFNTSGNTNTGKIFGNTPSSPKSIFGNTATTTFGAPNTNAPFGSIFGDSSSTNQNLFGSTNDSFRFSSNAESNIPSSDRTLGFNKPPFTTFETNSSNTDTTSFSFGNLGLATSTSTFGSGFSQNPFSRPSIQEQPKSLFSNDPLLGSSTTTSSSNIFGGSFNKTTPAFGGSATFGSPSTFGQASAFGQRSFTTTGSIFSGSSQSGPFSSSSQSVNQTGFGAAPVFGSSPTFGSSSPGGFGAPPAFGSSAFGVNSNFGSPNKIFLSAPTDSFGAANQQNSTFANLANQQTLGFGSLAQQSQTPTSQSAFSGGSSFSNWR